MQTYDPKKSTSEVRQGSGRLMNLRVLIFSVVGIIVVFALIYMLFGMHTPPAAQ
ncbi:MAG TPA: hypothetical protein VGM83_20515 [Devosiaceae bacterium]|jgi:hypothetical protein